MEQCLVSHDFIITVFCNVDDLWQEMTQGQKIRRRGFAPSLRDSEIIAMEIVGEFKGIETDKGIWSYFKGHWRHLFPQIKSRSTLIGQAANLWCYKQQMQQKLACQIGGLEDSVHLIDGLPVPLCHYRRAKAKAKLSSRLTTPSVSSYSLWEWKLRFRCAYALRRLFQGSASFGYCAARSYSAPNQACLIHAQSAATKNTMGLRFI